jgi:hypothetical protein
MKTILTSISSAFFNASKERFREDVTRICLYVDDFGGLGAAVEDTIRSVVVRLVMDSETTAASHQPNIEAPNVSRYHYYAQLRFDNANRRREQDEDAMSNLRRCPRCEP